jgi:hypothetical protein
MLANVDATSCSRYEIAKGNGADEIAGNDGEKN